MAVLQGFQELCGELIQGEAASLSYFAALGWGCFTLLSSIQRGAPTLCELIKSSWDYTESLSH